MATILEQILLASSSTQRASSSSSSFSSSYLLSESGSRGRDAFEWGASISALLLLVLNQTGRRSGLQASLLVLSLLITFPTVLFKILRGEFGYWVAFLAVASNFIFPHIIPVSRFLLFVVVPDWPTYELRESIAGGIICLLFAVLSIVTELHGIGESGSYRCNLHSLGYWFSFFLFLFFIILYLCLGPW
ncbi:Cold-regulated 413 plasma membrane protein 4-like protein [Drosera capensis]